MAKSNTATEYIEKQTSWQKELTLLRDLILETELEESIKWGIPVYTINGKNVVGMSAFKSYCGLWFFQGAFINDKANLLVNASEGKTKGMRQMRFGSLKDIDVAAVRAYLQDAINNQKAGKAIKPEKKSLEIPPELQKILDERPEVNDAFFSLSPGKQKEYAEHIAEAKREETRKSRLEKALPLILKRSGLYDRYK